MMDALKKIVLVLLVNLILWFWISAEQQYRSETRHSDQLIHDLQRRAPAFHDETFYSASSSRLMRSPDDSVVYLHWPSEGRAEPTFHVDSEFRLAFDSHVIAIRREVEICHWRETMHSVQVDDGDDDDSTTAARYSYTYDLDWRSHPISSWLFDQPILHHNPSRDLERHLFSVSSRHWQAPGASLGPWRLSSSLLHGAQLPFTPIAFWNVTQLTNFNASPMATAHGFRHLSGGWFYSPYQPANGDLLSVAQGVLLYSSLLDQITNPSASDVSFLSTALSQFFASCRAGDLRVRFLASSLSPSVSLVANRSSATDHQGEGDLLHPLLMTQDSSPLSLLSLGHHSAADLLQRAMKRQWYWLCATRVLCALVMCPLFLFLAPHLHWLLAMFVALCSALVVPWSCNTNLSATLWELLITFNALLSFFILPFSFHRDISRTLDNLIGRPKSHVH